MLPVGGIKEKVLAAERAGVRTVVLPSDNEADLEDVPDDIRERLSFVFVDSLDDVVAVAVERSRAPAAAPRAHGRARRGRRAGSALGGEAERGLGDLADGAGERGAGVAVRVVLAAQAGHARAGAQVEDVGVDDAALVGVLEAAERAQLLGDDGDAGLLAELATERGARALVAVELAAPAAPTGPRTTRPQPAAAAARPRGSQG